MLDPHPPSGRAPTLALAVSAVLALGGCASEPKTTVTPEVVVSSNSTQAVASARSGRYTLVELSADEAQRDLMHQVIDVTAPQGLAATVADMLRYVLLRSGYSICEGETLARFETLSLPAAHLHLGPVLLREALAVLAGPAWQLSVDDAARQVCFSSANPRSPIKSGENL